MYFCAIGNIEAAESRYEIIEELAPDHPDTKDVFPYLMNARLNAGKKRMEEEERTRINVKTNTTDITIQREIKAVFANKETIA